MTTRDHSGQAPREEVVRVFALTGADEDIPALAVRSTPRTSALWTPTRPAPAATMEDADDDDDGLPAVWGPLGVIGDGD